MKKREKLSNIELSTICRQLKIESVGGKFYNTDVANTEQLLRLIHNNVIKVSRNILSNIFLQKN